MFEVRELSRLIGELILRDLALELRDQGHKLTGGLIRSLEYKVRRTANEVLIDFFSAPYGRILNTGVPARKIPFSPGAPRGKTSKYIEGLIRYAKKRFGFSKKQATRRAFQIANAHKREGMPTRGSYRFSKNGRRTGWIDIVIEKDGPKVEEMIVEKVSDTLELLIVNYAQAA